MQRPSSPLSVLIIEDDENLRASIAGSLTSHGYQVSTACSSKEGLAQVQREQFDIVLTDLQLPEMDGINLIQKMRKLDSEADLVLMTAYGSSDIAIDALKAGAHDYISKPFSVDELLLTLRKIEQRRKSWCENAPLLAPGGLKPNFSSIIAESSSMKELFDTVKRLAMFNTTILITGESGTGKELLARAIHHNSPRRGKPFIAINCGAIPENLMESELFGHKKGS
ncbi:MAG: sigma-54-dependent Fis family transcriptional regulator, partial [Deltaproteobacteria bacterium]|nr:sigma-54-dependent Fis family transcriptional regulator [Deltaproteobacteria bacterium]